MQLCLVCPAPVPEHRIRHHAKYCSPECGKMAWRGRWEQVNPNQGLSSGTVGALHELLVAADLLRRGYEVFRPLSQAASCDLLVLHGRQLLRVEVTTGYHSPTGEIRAPARK